MAVMPTRPGWLRVALSAVSVTALMAACGGSHARRHPAGAKPITNQPFAWLIQTHGPQPSVAVENRHPGTGQWRLPGPPEDVGGLRSGNVAAYVADQAVTPGQTERIYVSAPGSPTVRITIFRIGWYGGAGGREVLASDPLRTVPQPGCTTRFATGLTECDWHSTLSFTIPPSLPSGVYIARLAGRTGQSDCLFVVRASTPQPLLAQLPTSTYEAYNAWGGDSLYPGGSDRVGLTGTTQGIEVSYDRPYDSVTGAGQFFARDVAMVWFLERYGYPASYTTSESVDADPGQLLGHRALLDFGHSEYWSQRQANAFTAARDAGTNLLFLSSDTLAWRVRYARASAAASEAGQPDHSLVAYKEHAALDPDRSAPTGPFPQGGAPLTGSSYLGCITPRLNVPGPPTYRYYAWAPAPGLQPRWLFAGTGITASTQIPGIVGYELDMRTSQSPLGTALVGAGSAPCMGAEPEEPSPGPGQNRAEATIYTARSGAFVFSSGTLGWELGLEPVPSASPDAPRSPDPRVVAMTRNLLERSLGYRPGR
jgi:N,N-dimethylformamidase beta subunit-like protein